VSERGGRVGREVGREGGREGGREEGSSIGVYFDSKVSPAGVYLAPVNASSTVMGSAVAMTRDALSADTCPHLRTARRACMRRHDTTQRQRRVQPQLAAG
jgi:hypothetical protein